MPHTRILTRLYNTPLAIAQDKLDVITSNVTLKLLSGAKPSALHEVPIGIEPAEPAQAQPAIGIVKVFDSLVSKNGAGASGFTSYESIASQITNLVSEEVKTIVFYIDSPGGEVAGLFGLADFIQTLSAKHGINTIAVTDGYMTSAAYVIGSACREVYATSTSIIGSIAVLMTLVNVVEADKQEGISYKIIRSKDDKALLNPHEPFNNKAIEEAIQTLSTLDTIMNDTVNAYRPQLTVNMIENLNGKTVLGEEALAIDLIDDIVVSLQSVIEKISSPKADVNFNLSKKGNVMTLEEALAENIRLRSELDARQNAFMLEMAKIKKEEQDRVVSIMDAAKTFSLSTDTAIKRIKAGTSVEATVEMFEAIKENLQIANPSPITTGLLPGNTPLTVATGIAPNADEAFMAELSAAMNKQNEVLFANIR